ncbi:helix-turn-helix transcriptional regulator [Bradyrhizobium sp. SZCCHNRI3037]|uniref:helix-turn-helix transcriptional regulator n=1 Tax=Bradyrhizobium sp. SZCCHNRI3037 TaxID=3057290 RepID=UPI002916CF8F|nr:helix-turn-helix transcriptional regulator [Bradyrhizobium sp. SZCCHNRI3037]
MQDSLLKAFEAIYDAAPNPAAWPFALRAIADCFGDAGALLMWHQDDGSFGTVVSPELLDAQRDYNENGWTRRDIGAIRAREKGYFFSGEPYATNHLLSRDEIRTDPFFVDFRAKHGLGGFGGIAVSPDRNIGVLLSMQAPASRHDYSDSELQLLRRIGRHVEKSLRLTVRLFHAELASLGLGDALTRLGIGAFPLDSLGRVVSSNRAGQSLIGDRLRIVQDHLQIGTGETREAIDEAISLALRNTNRTDSSPKPHLVPSAELKDRLVIYVIPVTKQASLTDPFLIDTRAIVLTIPQKSEEPADPALVRDALGLTLGEARVAALVGAGLRPREAAGRLGIAEDTARNVLKRIFSKVGISRQSELVALLAKVLLRSP